MSFLHSAGPKWAGLAEFVFLSGLLSLAFATSLSAQSAGPPPAAATPKSAATAPSTPAPTTPAGAPSSTAPATPKTAIPAAPGKGGDTERDIPGVAADATIQTVEVAARPTAILSAKAKWDQAFSSIKDSQARLLAAVQKAGLKPAGHPLTVFTETDDNGFSYQAMLPLAEKPAGKTDLPDAVTLGSSPSGKAIKFQHHGPYDDIDSTYDLITAYLDEKGLEAQDYFVEDYLTDLRRADDPNLAVDIYIFLK